VLLKQFLLPFHRKPHLLVLEVILRQLLVINNIVGIPDWACFSADCLFCVRLIGFEVDNVEVFLVF